MSSSAGRSRAKFPIDWGSLAPLRIRARIVADGVFAGMHRSVRKGAGVEFGGQRPYVPGDDLRFFDRRALLRHDRLMVREFETETDRAVWLCVDASASMAWRGPKAPGAKLAYAALLAAATARVAVASGDPVGLAWLGGDATRDLPAVAGREGYDRVLGALESAAGALDLSGNDAAVERALAPVARKARRGAVIVLFSDLLDLPPRTLSAFSALATGGRVLVVVQVLDPAEATLDFQGHVRLRAVEGDAVVEADIEAVRAEYKKRLADIATTWDREITGRGGRFLQATTDADATEIVRAIVTASATGPR
ncbi:DUF58 domain-containing protein [Chondromyces crocatus]|uniref:DUF58 domain-containing protein n=1 Tax=Chondromyces crocatus TaxID=52 RepID=A0A0K1E965_CHOCO|nr:DUF58 domain-containing protein [Chondromyces crocatus]AKT37415.1 uncharacterized protein CMC5_015560 [Chondromyces crocatus]